MRLLLTLTAMLCVVGFAANVAAEDGFGSRFSADTPAALQDDPEAALSEIAPAAGEEEPATGEEEAVQAEDSPETQQPQGTEAR